MNHKELHEGIWFSVVLPEKRVCLGLISRISRSKRIALCYFFDTQNLSITDEPFVNQLAANDSIAILIVSTLGFTNDEWHVIAKEKYWNRSKWPVPQFFRYDVLNEKMGWIVTYSDDEPDIVISETRGPLVTTLEKDSLYGYKAAEEKLKIRLAQV